MLRACLPEMLDSLPPDHPDAIHNRRDLRLINRVMRNHAWIERTLPALVREGECVLELGAGTGELAGALAARGVPVDGLDIWPRPDAWPSGRAWYVADLRAFSGFARYSAVVANLILHQFTDAELGALGAKLRQSARVIIACEPERRRISQIATAALAPLFGANHVTLHDAHVSIGAGFCRDELARLLGLADGSWQYSCRTTPLGANRLLAVRRG
jgi:hypothetical protein